ncbi:MAG: HAD-IA family hydrolase [Verrucomicrobiales bacterium]|nr:HAD-IA family hydrolase [Verrucomicrobiales bacterium]
MSDPSVKALSFDAAGTLIELTEPVGHSYYRVAMAHGIHSDPSTLALAFKSVWKKTPPAFSNQSPFIDLDEKSWWHRLVRNVFVEAGASLPPPPAFETFFEDLYLHFETPGTWRPIADAKETLDILSSHYPCIVLSNFDGRLRKILTDLNLSSPFQSVLLSCELGASKPDPLVFSAARKLLGEPPENILHIGDDPHCDWEGAARAGFQSFRVGTGESSLKELLRQLSLA